MEIAENHIKIEKSARYFSLGSFNEKTKTVWILLHGYGQLAKDFIDNFNSLADDSTFIFAPEALHKFYRNNRTGEVGASWMTKEDRLNEIDDNNNYLDKIVQCFSGENIKLNLLGFSQGCATASRWIAGRKQIVNNLYLWGSSIPEDLDLSEVGHLFSKSNLKLIIGEKDRIVKPEYIKAEFARIKDAGVECELISFNGGHEIRDEVLSELG